MRDRGWTTLYTQSKEKRNHKFHECMDTGYWPGTGVTGRSVLPLGRTKIKRCPSAQVWRFTSSTSTTRVGAIKDDVCANQTRAHGILSSNQAAEGSAPSQDPETHIKIQTNTHHVWISPPTHPPCSPDIRNTLFISDVIIQRT